ncbi:hypothetical protein BDR26DRAFT_865858 [Obelidium mucronatum]|nr:hypothetical protein BDR26DRAFT_865858 [Obelidium mucronatum]
MHKKPVPTSSSHPPPFPTTSSQSSSSSSSSNNQNECGHMNLQDTTTTTTIQKTNPMCIQNLIDLPTTSNEWDSCSSTATTTKPGPPPVVKRQGTTVVSTGPSEISSSTPSMLLLPPPLQRNHLMSRSNQLNSVDPVLAAQDQQLEPVLTMARGVKVNQEDMSSINSRSRLKRSVRRARIEDVDDDDDDDDDEHEEDEDRDYVSDSASSSTVAAAAAVAAAKNLSNLRCGECGRTGFRKRHHFASHLVTHSNDYSFVCNIPGCTSKFRRKQDLLRHLRNVKH